MNTTIYRTIKMKPIEVKDNTYNVVQKKVPCFFFIPKLCFTIFFISFRWCRQQAWKVFYHQYGSNWTLYYAETDKNHQAVLCSNTVLLAHQQCRKYFGRKNVPDRRTTLFGIITENIQMYGNTIRNPSENQHVVPLKKLAFREHKFW